MNLGVRVEEIVWAGRSWSLIREDLVHSQVPGPKYRRLQAWLEEAHARGATRLLTAGGPASNHLHGLAVLAHERGWPVEAVVRGEGVSTPLLQEAEALGMKLTRLPKVQFDAECWGGQKPVVVLGTETCFVPMGAGGVPGHTAMTNLGQAVGEFGLDTVCLTAGTGTTLRGLVEGLPPKMRFLVATPFRDPSFLREGLSDADLQRVELLGSVGGRRFGRVDPTAQEEAVDFVRKTGIWTDNLYMPQLLFHLKSRRASDYFAEDSRVGILHCGGAVYNRIDADLAEW